MSKKVSKTTTNLFRILTVYAKLEILLGLALLIGGLGYLAMTQQLDEPKTSLGESHVQNHV